MTWTCCDLRLALAWYSVGYSLYSGPGPCRLSRLNLPICTLSGLSARGQRQRGREKSPERASTDVRPQSLTLFVTSICSLVSLCVVFTVSCRLASPRVYMGVQNGPHRRRSPYHSSALSRISGDMATVKGQKKRLTPETRRRRPPPTPMQLASATILGQASHSWSL